MEELDATVCPYCNDGNETTTEDLELGKEIHYCWKCKKKYEVIYEIRVKEIRKL